MNIKNPISTTLLCATLLWGASTSVYANEDKKQFVEMPKSGETKEKAEETKVDTRINLGFTPSEKAVFLAEMRQMLVSIQGVIAGIGSDDPEQIMKAARYSGNRMSRATPKSIKKKTPLAFKQLGGPTHMMFEELVIRAETDDMDILAEFTGKLMKQCIACHATFKASD